MFWNRRKRLKGLTLGIVFSSVGSSEYNKKHPNDEESSSGFSFCDLLVPVILDAGGLPIELSKEHLAVLQNGNTKDACTTAPQAHLFLFGELYHGIYNNTGVAYVRVTCRCLTRNGTIVGGGSFFDNTYAQTLEPMAKRILSLIYVENLGPLELSGYQEKLFQNGEVASVVE